MRGAWPALMKCVLLFVIISFRCKGPEARCVASACAVRVPWTCCRVFLMECPFVVQELWGQRGRAERRQRGGDV